MDTIPQNLKVCVMFIQNIVLSLLKLESRHQCSLILLHDCIYVHKKESSTLSNCFIQLPLNGMGYAKCKGCGCKLVIGHSHRMHAHVKCIYIYT